jgi:hypothetical protein
VYRKGLLRTIYPERLQPPGRRALLRAPLLLSNKQSFFISNKAFHHSSSPNEAFWPLFISNEASSPLSSSPTKLPRHSLYLQQSFSYPDPNIVYWLAVAPSLSTHLSSATTPTPASYACWCSLLLSVSPFHFSCYAYLPPSCPSPWTPARKSPQPNR